MASASPSQRHGFGARDMSVVAMMDVLWRLNIIAMKVAVGQIAPLTAGLLRQAIVCAALPGRMRPLTGLMLAGGGIAMAGVAIVTIRSAQAAVQAPIEGKSA